MSEEVAQVLDRAHDIIVERGWCQGEIENEKGEVCAIGALNAVRGYHYDPVFTLTQDALRRVGVHPSIPVWNDAPGRTRRQVLLAFRRAAKAERSTP